MPSEKTVLVTGASAFIGTHVVYEALKQGFRVLGTVRTKEKGEYTAKVVHNDRFSFVVVPNIEAKGVFDGLVRQVDYVIHLAAPFTLKFQDARKELIAPAVDSTLSVLEAAHQHGPHIRRIVFTSSNAAFHDPEKSKRGHVFGEQDWNTWSVAEFEAGRAAPVDAYRTAKTRAEQAAWKWMDDNKPSFDIATMNPPYAYGPVMQKVSKPEDLNVSVAAIYKLLKGEEKLENKEQFAEFHAMLADVRDIAYVHVKALTAPKAGGHRFPIASARFGWQTLLDVIPDHVREVFPDCPTGFRGCADNLKGPSLDPTNCQDLVGLTFTPYQKTFIDMVESLAAREQSSWLLEPLF